MATETTFAVEVTRPLSNIDLKFYIKYDELYKNGTEHTLVLLTRYSTNKEIVAKTSVFIPKGNLFGFDATFLLTVPDLGTCSSSVRVQEKLQKSYLVKFMGKIKNQRNNLLIAIYFTDRLMYKGYGSAMKQ